MEGIFIEWVDIGLKLERPIVLAPPSGEQGIIGDVLNQTAARSMSSRAEHPWILCIAIGGANKWHLVRYDKLQDRHRLHYFA